ncbi:SDR family oxidoreductase [Achromobacter denitrificans]|uniref:3-oxoacyl-ACP reductase n=1 Tax=Achromobacter denitrificans TaxID=32002 RepID=UPI000B4924E7|nr:3-oxoacyl-ACP reductase [Achromobacter denitrificans]MDX3879195.1 3-oxoacyl-ACP reductase [Achromobacter sp.]ASC64223.1 3-ketoacyl-ACP reductase [Achromobacter denitrificans]MBV2157824.1 3-oxoacyl-ACP reductase [Achromobacter denitrificans]MDF3858809.1 3-oxoacyl-ACP reductase [Achromobacter denitrificans]MDF3939071.1 3-oxoacyl-ACP reductase [Achromobacter denitrificans]
MKRDPSKVALVTGAGRGIGLEVARLLLAKGYRVLAVSREGVDAQKLGGPSDRLRAECADVTDYAAMQALVDGAREAWGPVSVLMNNAGISPKQANGNSSGILDIAPAEWDLVLQVNLTSILRLCQMVLPAMRDQGWGRIVNVSSLAGRAKSLVAGGSYMASKAGVLGLTRAIAAEMGPFGITANAVTPGRILTEMAQQAAPSVNENYAAQIPARRLGTPEEVAAAMVFLAAEESGFINGAILDVNGGFYMP